jgi:NitT/TauT family transport system substrate-binding protein
LEKGFFKEAGVGDVKLIWSGPGDSPLSELASGKVDFCTGWFADAIVRRSKGVPVVLLSQIMRDSAMMLVTWADDEINVPEEMTGKRVGLWGGDFSIPPKAFFYKYKVKPIVTPQTPSIQPFMLRAVSVASAMYYNEYHTILQTGTKPEQLKVFTLADYGLNIPEDGLYTTEAMRRGRPALCRKLSHAIQQGWDYAFEHEAETIEAVMQYCKTHKANTNRSHQRWMLRAMKKYIQPEDKTHRFGQLTAAMYDDAIELLQQQKVLNKAPEYGMFYQPTH